MVDGSVGNNGTVGCYRNIIITCKIGNFVSGGCVGYANGRNVVDVIGGDAGNTISGYAERTETDICTLGIG